MTAPSLNFVVILLAFQLLPLELAIARTVLGLAAAVGVTYALAKLFPGVATVAPDPMAGEVGARSLRQALGIWLSHTWEVTKSTVPLLVLGIFVISLLKVFLPLEAMIKSLGDGAVPTFLASLLGTVLMVPTFTEVLWVQEFTR